MKKVLSNAAIGKFIREKRIELNYTQDELANKMKVTKTAVSNWENGNAIVDVKYLVKLSNLFSVTVDEVLFPNTTSERSHEYSDASHQFQCMMSFTIEDVSLCKKLLDLYIDCKIQLMSLIKQYSETKDPVLFEKIRSLNAFGFSFDDEPLDARDIDCKTEKDQPICDSIETRWTGFFYWDKNFNINDRFRGEKFILSDRPLLFCNKNELVEFIKDKEFINGIHAEAFMLNYIFYIGGERIFRKYISTFSQDYKNRLLGRLILFSCFVRRSTPFNINVIECFPNDLLKEEKRAISCLLHENAKFIIDEKDYTSELMLKIYK